MIMLPKLFLRIIFVLQFFWEHKLVFALHESCSGYFDGFSLPEDYNPNAPPDTANLDIKNEIIVREISNVSIVS